MKNKWMLAVAMSAVSGIVQADNLCKVNPYAKAEAEQGKLAFNSRCAHCHQYNLSGRIPGNYMNESPDINLPSEGDLEFLVSNAIDTFQTKDTVVPNTYIQVAAYVLYKNCGKI